MRHNLFISLVLAATLTGAGCAGTVVTKFEPPKREPSAVPRALFYEKESPVITADMLLTSGYLTSQDHPFGSVIDFQQPDKRAASPGDNIYINKGSKAGVKKEDQFFIYHRSDPISDPDTRDEIGYIVTMVGIITVNDVKEDVALARVERAFNMVFVGDALMPVYEVTPPRMDPDRPLDEKTVEGKIVYVRHGKGLISQDDIVYLNIGRKDGVQESDIFKVLEQDKDNDENTYGIRKDIGRLMVILVKENTATAIAVTSKSEVKTGDLVSYVQER